MAPYRELGHRTFILPKVHLPLYGDFQFTKFMVLELLAAILIVAIYVPVARWASTGEPPNGGPVKRLLLEHLRVHVDLDAA